MKILDRFSTFGLPIESTEVSLSLHDKQLQAVCVRRLHDGAVFRAAGAGHDSVGDSGRSRLWRPEAGMFDVDWTPEPTAKVWTDTTQKQWSTDTTGGDRRFQPQASVRGFYGSSVTSP